VREDVELAHGSAESYDETGAARRAVHILRRVIDVRRRSAVAGESALPGRGGGTPATRLLPEGSSGPIGPIAAGRLDAPEGNAARPRPRNDLLNLGGSPDRVFSTSAGVTSWTPISPVRLARLTALVVAVLAVVVARPLSLTNGTLAAAHNRLAVTAHAPGPAAEASARADVDRTYGRPPLRFEANAGQTDHFG
jgi:hypothetical protein